MGRKSIKKWMMGVLCLSASAAVSNDQILDNLVNASASIATSMNTGLQVVGGLATVSATGQVVQVGAVNNALISTTQREAYNSALVAMSQASFYGFEQFAEDRAAEALDNMSEAIDTFVAVTVELATVVEVADLSVQAQENNDMQQKEELARYVEDNVESFTVTETQVETWNESLEDVEEYSSTAASWTAASQHDGAVAWADSVAETNGRTFTDTSTAYFDREIGAAIVSWDDFFLGVTASGINAYVDLSDVMDLGATTSLYLDGPTQTSYRCFVFNECE